MTYQLFQEVVLAIDVPEKGLQKGDVATIVEEHPVVGGERGYTLELFNALGETIAVVTVPESAMALVGEMKILVPLAGIIDKAAELARLDKDITNHQDNIAKGEAKLANPGFTDKAPAAVVEKERQRVAELVKTLEQLKEQAEKIKKL